MSYSNGRNFLIEREKAQAKNNYFKKCLKPETCHCDTCNKPESCQCQRPESCQCHKQEPRKDETNKWNALDPSACHPFDATVEQDTDANVGSLQQSIESIVIKDSCDVEVTTTDIQAAVNVQLVLQIAIALVISISIADSSKADTIAQDLNAKLKSSQINKQQVYIENSRGVNVFTTDTDLAVNIQLLLQVLVAIVARLDVL